MTTPLLQLQHVTKRYGDVHALVDMSLEVPLRRFVVLLGPSGSGKSTLLRCAAGIERISSGGIYLDGELIDDGSRQVPPERRDLAMVFQDYALWPHLTARQNVAYALRRRRLHSGQAGRQAAAMLERVGLGALAERYPVELSGGEQQRVALARALVASPRLLLFDEPLSNLDTSLRERMRVEIATLVREAGATALYITHDQAEAFALADQIGILERGVLMQFDTPEAIYSTPATPFVARLTGLSGELAGSVVRLLGDDLAEVTVGNATFNALTRAPNEPGTSVRVLVRPSAIRLLAPTSSEAQVLARVRDVAFSGRGYLHVVELADGHTLSGVFHETRWERESNVGVQLDPAGCIVFREVVRPTPQPTVSVPTESLGERLRRPFRIRRYGWD